MFIGQERITLENFFINKMIALDKLKFQNDKQKFICVGLDSDLTKIPKFLLEKYSNPILEFNERIISATTELAAAYKFNLAFYESLGINGYKILFDSLQTIPGNILVIADGKRGDIGNTSKKYAEMLYNEFDFDAATLNPYMGYDSLEPFLAYANKMNFIISLTSNPGSADFEKLKLSDDTFFYQHVIKKVKEWNVHQNCGLVFGATNFDELVNDINLFEGLPVLLPGVGAQGGNLEEVVKLFKERKHQNFLFNVSRGIIYNSADSDFADKASEELRAMNDIVSKILFN